MKFIRKSIIGKATLFLLLCWGMFYGLYLYLNSLFWTEVRLDFVFYAITLLLVLIYILFTLNVYRPLAKLAKQITNLLTGKIYRRISASTIDEVGVATHFFNEITQDLEKISYDVKERRRMSSELDIAATIQHDVLPKETPEIPGLNIVAKTRAAAEVGGDLFDFIPSADGSQVYIYIGDVTGHGVPSGLIMMMMEILVTSLIFKGVMNSQELVIQTNGLLYPRISSRLFMTSVVMRWDKVNQKMYYTGAGHEHILVYRHKTEEVEAIVSGGIALGMIPDVSKIAVEKEIALEIGDCIVLYSDGITEAKNQFGEMYTMPRLKESFQKNGYKPYAEGIFDSLTKDFSNFVGEYVQIDDTTMIVIKCVEKDSANNKVALTISKDQAEAMPKSKTWHWV